eukprot:EC689923.1.p2 GENE.EC689923.1~~EC689923.1.p2  ORF type:complete len:81 (-),score=9.76 EC689923.1:159-401(-)
MLQLLLLPEGTLLAGGGPQERTASCSCPYTCTCSRKGNTNAVGDVGVEHAEAPPVAGGPRGLEAQSWGEASKEKQREKRG